MRLRQLLLPAAALIAAALLLPPVARASQTKLSFVSVQGNDSNTFHACSFTSPCRTLAAANSVLFPDSRIFVMDSGDFGPVTITKSVRIIGFGGEASVGRIVIAGNASTDVYLEGLTLRNDLNTPPKRGDNGLRVAAARSLHLRDCLIQGWGDAGVRIDAAGPLEVHISHSTIDKNVFGLWARAADGAIDVVLDGVTITSSSNLAVRVARNGTRAWLNATTITHNAKGLEATKGGQILSFGNNALAGNDVDGAPTQTLPPQ